MSCLRAMSSWVGSVGLKTDEAKVLAVVASVVMAGLLLLSAAAALVGVGLWRRGDLMPRGTLAFIKTGSGRSREQDAVAVVAIVVVVVVAVAAAPVAVAVVMVIISVGEGVGRRGTFKGAGSREEEL